MKLIYFVLILTLVGCGAVVADQPIPASPPAIAPTTALANAGASADNELWTMIVDQAFIIEARGFIIEALQAEIIALKDDGADYGYVYEVKSGQSLWIIADEVLGDPYKWVTIHTMNYWMGDPDMIYPSQMLLLP